MILLVPTVLLIRFMSRRRVRSLATLLTKAIMAEEEVATEAAKANAPKAGRSMRHLPLIDGAVNTFKVPKKAVNNGKVTSLDALAVRLRADLRAARVAKRAARRHQQRHGRKETAAEKKAREDTEAATQSQWLLSKAGQGQSSSSSNGVGNDASKSDGTGLDALDDWLLPSSCWPWLLNKSEEGDMEQRSRPSRTQQQPIHRRRRRLAAMASDAAGVSRAQHAARALHSLSDNLYHESVGAMTARMEAANGTAAERQQRRETRKRAITEAMFWEELAHAMPALIDTIVKMDDAATRRRVGRMLRNACWQVVDASEHPESSTINSVHHHPRLLNLRYAPIVREVHRPLLLSFFVQNAVEVEKQKQREPIQIVRLRPPAFMGPPSRAPVGGMAAPPGRLSEPKEHFGSSG